VGLQNQTPECAGRPDQEAGWQVIKGHGCCPVGAWPGAVNGAFLNGAFLNGAFYPVSVSRVQFSPRNAGFIPLRLPAGADFRMDQKQKSYSNQMKHLHITCALSSLIAALTVSALAQGPPQGPPPPLPDPVGAALDKNNNQKLSTAEIKAAIKSLLKLDKDKSNSLSADELKPAPPRRRGGGRGRDGDQQEQMPQPQPPSVLMTALDTDSNGELSKAELANAVKAIAALDRDGDHELSEAESGIIKPTKPDGGQNGGGQGGGGQGGPPGGGPPRGGGSL
jgi:hypothetical protein